MAAVALTRALVVLLAAAVLASAPSSPASAETVGANASSDEGLQWPERRFAPCAAFDDAHGDWFVFGGRSEGGGLHFADVWRIDVRRRAPRWHRVTDGDAEGAPPPLRSCAAAFDRHAGRLLVFGGWNGVTPTNGVWALTPGATPRWQRLCDATSCGTPPSARRAAQAVYDPIRRRLLVFGGLDTQYRNDTWELTLDGAPAWRQLPPVGPQPPARGGHSLVYDRRGRRAWLFGGTTSGPDLGDTWTFDLATDTWTALTPSACAAGCPPARSGAVLVHDLREDRLVLHGGWESGPNRYPRDTWTLENLGEAPVWARAQIDSEAPKRRYFGVGAYDRETRRLLEFGGGIGATALRTPPCSTWACATGSPGVVWRRARRSRPATRSRWPSPSVAIACSPSVASVPGPSPGSSTRAHTWADSWSLGLTGGGVRWRNVTPPAWEPNPLHREAAAVATDTRRGRMVMVGGLEGDDELADVWAADLDRGPARWRQLCSPSSCGPGPAARWGAHAVYDPVADRIVVFGGRRSDGTSFADVWALSLGARRTGRHSSLWATRRPRVGAPPRAMTPPGGAWSSAAARPGPTATPSATTTPGHCRSTTRPPGACSRLRARGPSRAQPCGLCDPRDRRHRPAPGGRRAERRKQRALQRRLGAHPQRRRRALVAARGVELLVSVCARVPAIGRRGLRRASRSAPARPSAGTPNASTPTPGASA